VNVLIEGYLCDFVWSEERVIVETDGKRVHGIRKARERDPVRDADLQLAGWIVIRVIYVRLLNEPDAVAAQLREALRPSPEAPAAPRRS
jgi:very-short-patch-repair endonuclease